MAQIDPQPITFEEAIEQTKASTRHLLLGNGFSISARPSFRYQSLFEAAEPFSAEVKEIFQRLDTQDFEQVLEDIRQLSQETADEKCISHEKEVREAFLRALSTVHPDSSWSISREEAENCASFLEHFVGLKRPLKLRGRVYTTNYDLLLYWVIARFQRRLSCYDSHEGQRHGVWDPNKAPSLVYLHGGLHLYDASEGQIMLRYDGERSLIGQSRKLLARGRFPVIVAEGTSQNKVARIQRSKYLKRMSRYLMTGFKDPNAVLFTYGHSLSERDAHLLRSVGEGCINAVYVGAYGGLGGDQSNAVHDWAAAWSEARVNCAKPPLQVWVYDTSAFSPWRRLFSEAASLIPI